MFDLDEIKFEVRYRFSKEIYEKYCGDGDLEAKINFLCDASLDLDDYLESIYDIRNDGSFIRTLLDMNLRGKQIIEGLRYLHNDHKLFRNIIMGNDINLKKDLIENINMNLAMELNNKVVLSGALNMDEDELEYTPEEKKYFLKKMLFKIGEEYKRENNIK